MVLTIAQKASSKSWIKTLCCCFHFTVMPSNNGLHQNNYLKVKHFEHHNYLPLFGDDMTF